MRKIILRGELGRKFGRVHLLDVKNVSEAVRALCANFKDFRKYLIEKDKEKIGYKVFIGKDGIKEDQEYWFPVSTKESITIVPVIAGQGSGDLKVIAGVALIVVGAITYNYGGAFLIKVGIGLTLAGIVQLLTPVPALPNAGDRQQTKAGYIFNGPVNTTVQGFPVPLAFGRMFVGSAVVSAGITVEELKQ